MAQFAFKDWISGLFSGKTSPVVAALQVNAAGDAIANNNGELSVLITDPDTGDKAKVNTDGQLHIVAEGHLCTENSTTTPLLAGATFTGTAENILAYNGIAIFVTSDVASATGGLEIQYSKDGATNWNTAESYTVKAGAKKFFTPPSFGIFFRVKYTNGAADQTTFELTTKLAKLPFKWSSHNIADAITDEDDAELTKSVITGKKADGNYDNVSLTNGGNMKVSLEELESGVSDDSNAALKVSPYIIDEFNGVSRLLGDNLFKGALVTIASEHHEIHCGDSYVATHIEDVAGSSTHLFLITVPNESGTYPDQNHKVFHAVFEGFSESEGEWELFEAPTVTGAGTAVAVLNRNRNSALTDFLTVSEGATVSANGTKLEGFHIGSGRGIGGEGRSDEWVLANNTTYLVKFTNSVATANHITLRVNYYVHPGI